jgi:glycine/D-amino acid oxidase-like deaminating enzyme
VGLGMVVKEGGVVRGGCEVVGLQKEGKRVEGVVLKSGEVVKGDIVLVCSSLIDRFVDANGRLLLALGMSSMRVRY